MTDEKAINILDSCENTLSMSDDFVCAIERGINALVKREKYKWHDLRKNPEDLPEDDNTVVLTALRTPELSYETFDVGFIKVYLDSFIAWRYIEPFEEDEE